jgi:hypothetical protein
MWKYLRLTLYGLILRLTQSKSQRASGLWRELQVGPTTVSLVEKHHAFGQIVSKRCRNQWHLLPLDAPVENPVLKLENCCSRGLKEYSFS